MGKPSGRKKNIREIIDELYDALSKDRLKGYFGNPVHTEKIELFEKAFGVRLPGSFKTFLRNFDGGFVADEEADNMIMAGEFRETEQISIRFLSIEEIILEYEDMMLDDWNLNDDFDGFYPYIPFCIMAGFERLVFVDNSLREEESKVFAAFHDTPASSWFVVTENFTEFLENYFYTGGHPDFYGHHSEVTAEDFLGLLNDRKDEKDDPREAIKRTTAYLKLFPDNSIKYTIRGDAYSEMKQYNKALADFNKSLELDPGLALAYYCRGTMLLSVNKARQALIELDSACKLEPDDPYYLTGRAEALFALGKTDIALADCNRAIEIDNHYFSAYYLRHKIYNSVGETEKAEADAKVIEELLGEDE